MLDRLNQKVRSLVAVAVLLSPAALQAAERDAIEFLAGHVVAEAPPYYTLDEGGLIDGGNVFDLITEAFPGRPLSFRRLPFRRSQELAARPDFNGCVLPWSEKLRDVTTLHVSEEYFVEYHNKVISMASSTPAPQAIDDLENLRVLAFPGASLFLGESFRRYAQRSSNYRELENLDDSFVMLFKGRIDALVMDRLGFIYHANLKGFDYDNNSHRIRMGDLFEPVGYKLACSDRAWVEQFDRAKKRLRDSGRYEAILRRNSKVSPAPPQSDQ